MKPWVSILTPVYNGWEYLGDCVGGVLAQKEGTAGPWEWLVGVNGHGPTGGAAYAHAVQVVRAAAHAGAIPPDCSIQVLNLPHVQGKVATMNLLAKTVASADWVAVLDCDDFWLPGKLAAQRAALAGPAAGAAVVGTQCSYCGELEGYVPRLPCGWIAADFWRKENPLINSSALLQRGLAHWEDRFGLDDYDLWIRLSLAGHRFYALETPFVRHRLHAASAFNGKGGQDAEGLQRFYEA